MAKLKRKVKKKLMRYSIFILFLLIIVGGALYYKKFNHKEDVPSKENVPSNDNNTPEETQESKLSLLMTGDGLIHNQLALYAQTNDGYDFKPYLSEIKDYVKSFDLAYYNQETPFGTPGHYTFYPVFSVPSEYGDAMIDAGFNMVSLASNHAFDAKENGVINSLNYWRGQDNIMFNGTADSFENQKNYQIMEKNNITYALLSYTYGTNGINVPSGKEYLVSVYSDELAKRDIEALRDKVDVLIVAMHWGVEYQLEPTATQKSQAEYLASLGVDIVIGNHPHCLQPIEWKGDTLVIYSLGNFISNQIELYSSIGYKGAVGAFAMVNIEKDKSNNIDINDLKVDLIFTYRNETDKYYKVVPFSKITSKYLPDYQNVYTTYKNVIQKYDSNIEVIPAAT